MKNMETLQRTFGTVGNEKYELDPQKLDEHTKMVMRCRERALFLIEASEKTERRLREKLRKANRYPEDVIEDTIQFLKQYGYLDDEQLAARYVEAYAASRSVREIRQKLFQKGFSEQVIKNSLSVYCEKHDSGQAEQEAAEKLIRKKIGSRGITDEATKKKLYAFLVRKGFSYDQAAKALKISEGEMGSV